MKFSTAMPIKQFLSLAFVCAFCQVSAQLNVINPMVENLQNPIGLDVDSPRFSWQLSSPQRNVIQTTYEIKVAENAANLSLSKSLLWASGRVNSDASVWVPYTGPALQSGKKYYWQVRVWDNFGQESVWSEPAFWQMGLRSPADWKAKWITVSAPEDSLKPSPMFRKTFKLAKKVASATAYITAHGMYEAFINGKRIGEDYLTPGWTAYQKRLQYQTYDVTRLLQAGENAAGIVLGNGWWRGNIGFSGQRNFYGKDISVLCQIEVVFVDGSRATIVTDESWTYTTNGPIRSSEIYHGETYDSRMEIKDWSRMEFDGRSWRQVAVADFGAQTLIATYNEPVRKHETFPAKKIFRTPKGELVVDFGQNLVGWVSMFAQGKPGDEITIQFAEVLDKEGNFYTDNLRDAKCTDRWFLSGRGKEYFEPHFTFHGFRYAKIGGYPGELTPEHIEAVALYSDMKPAGSFVCSEPLINQLQHNIQWGQRGNFLDVPTDCPQRDERLGWTGDAQAFSRTAMFNFDTHNFFAKWLKDVAADQRADGMVPFVVPHV
ncbi:MAG: family 78 glycoside hydrolase catalytic domain, partial [Saprospiraceae bacterium]|nr:family 78 glycoside hydrolase catalytic domain [Saprospiraceae bacterium]